MNGVSSSKCHPFRLFDHEWSPASTKSGSGHGLDHGKDLWIGMRTNAIDNDISLKLRLFFLNPCSEVSYVLNLLCNN